MEVIVENKQIDYIYHLADIHISKNTFRHDEYKEVLNILLEKINPNENSVIVICGDITNEKSRLSPEQIKLVKEYIISLANIHDVIIILGNHDVNMNDKSDDAVSAIMDDVTTTNRVFILDGNKNYQFGDVVFVVTKMDALTTTDIIKLPNKTYVGLYHGTLHGSNVENGFVLSNNNLFTVEHFKKYDFSCLGDIHKFQYMNKQKTIAYCSSLIQQNIGEHPDEHGFLKWNVNNKSSEFIKIDNPYKMIKMEINNVNKVIINSDITNKAHVHIYYVNYDYAYNYAEQLKIKYPNIKYSLHCDKLTIMPNIKVHNTNIQDITDKTKLYNIVVEHLRDTYETAEENIKNIMLNQVEELINDEEICMNNPNMDKKNIVIEMLKYDNFCLYGSGNIINYNNLQGIVGIDAPSYSGKSASIDCLLYAIYGRCSRGDVSDIINTNERNTTTHIILSVNGIRYEILRDRSILRRKTKTTNISTSEMVVFKKYNDKILTQANVTETNNLIELIVGSYEDFIRTVIMLQHNDENIINMRKIDRRQYICNIMNLNVLTDLINLIKSHKTRFKCELKELHFDDTKTINYRDETEINILEQEIKQLKTDINNLYTEKGILKGKQLINKNINSLYDRKTKLESELIINIIPDNNDYETLIKSLLNINNNLHELNNKLIKCDGNDKQLDNYKNQLTLCKQRLMNSKKNKSSNTDIDENNVKVKVIELDNNINVIRTKHNIKDKLINAKIIMEINKLRTEMNKYNVDTDLNTLYDDLNKINIDNTSNLTNDINIKQTQLQKLRDETNNKYNDKCTKCKLNRIEHDNNISLLQEEINNLEAQHKLNIIIQNKKQVLLDKIANKKQYNLLEIEYNKYNDYKLLLDYELERDKLQQSLDNYYQYKIKVTTEQELQNNINNYTTLINNIETNITYNNQIKLLEIQQKELENKIEQKTKYDKFIKNKNNLVLELDKVTNDIKEEERKIEEYNKYHEKYKQIKKLISTNEIKLHELDTKLTSIKHEIMQNNILFKKYETDKLSHIKKTNKLASLELILKALSGENGIINSILDKVILPNLEQHINNILNEFESFQIKIIRVGETGINFIKNGKLNIEMNSGCEKFLLNIASRLALNNMNTIMHCNMIIMDECMSCCDEKTINKLPLLFDYIKNNYKFAIIISHDERIKKLYDSVYSIQIKHGGNNLLIN